MRRSTVKQDGDAFLCAIRLRLACLTVDRLMWIYSFIVIISIHSITIPILCCFVTSKYHVSQYRFVLHDTFVYGLPSKWFYGPTCTMVPINTTLIATTALAWLYPEMYVFIATGSVLVTVGGRHCLDTCPVVMVSSHLLEKQSIFPDQCSASVLTMCSRYVHVLKNDTFIMVTTSIYLIIFKRMPSLHMPIWVNLTCYLNSGSYNLISWRDSYILVQRYRTVLYVPDTFTTWSPGTFIVFKILTYDTTFKGMLCIFMPIWVNPGYYTPRALTSFSSICILVGCICSHTATCCSCFSVMGVDDVCLHCGHHINCWSRVIPL